jgi:predicted nucleotidyltransferase
MLHRLLLKMNAVRSCETMNADPCVSSAVDVLGVDQTIELISPRKWSSVLRQDIFEFVREEIILKAEPSARVFLFGSVPIRAFLPDGDIDIGALLAPNVKVLDFFQNVMKVLDAKMQDPESRFKIRSVLFINAEVCVI